MELRKAEGASPGPNRTSSCRTNQPINQSINQSICLSVCLSVCVCVCLSVCLYVCMYVSLSHTHTYTHRCAHTYLWNRRTHGHHTHTRTRTHAYTFHKTSHHSHRTIQATNCVQPLIKPKLSFHCRHNFLTTTLKNSSDGNKLASRMSTTFAEAIVSQNTVFTRENRTPFASSWSHSNIGTLDDEDT